MPNVIARMSITKLPISSPLLHANRSPARTDRSTGSCSVTSVGGWGRSIAAAMNIAMNVAASSE